MKNNINIKSKKIISVDGLRGIKKANRLGALHKLNQPILNKRPQNSRVRIVSNKSPRQKLPVVVSMFLLSAGFALGAWFVWGTDQSSARGEVLGAATENPVSVEEPLMLAVSETPNAYESVAQIPDNVFLSFTISQLEVQIREITKTPQMRQTEMLSLRKERLKKYLLEKNSPFAEMVNVIAELKHWKIVLAISNSESSLGKRCHSENCSGIGVEPGHPLWREYKSKAEWAKDMDRLIEKRYKDWTLEEMNGVYNQPGSKNWIKAARQILEELQERGIE